MVKLNPIVALAATLTVFCALGPRGWAAPADEALPLVTVELFTSQGCSSCPPADAYLAELAKRPDVIALSLPVDYWDYLGWRDTLALPEHAKRQYAYAESLGTQRPYTPQIVVDGRYDCVGNDKTNIEFAIHRFQKQHNARVPVAIAQAAGLVTVSVGALPEDGHKKKKDASHATVWLVRYEPMREVPIAKGENEGRSIAYTNVVRNWSPLGMWDGTPVTFRLSRPDLGGDGAGFAVLVQENGTGPIVGAARFTLAN